MEYQDPIIRFDLGAQVFHLTFSLSYFSVICLNVIKQPFLFGIKNITLHDELQNKMQQIFMFMNVINVVLYRFLFN